MILILSLLNGLPFVTRGAVLLPYALFLAKLVLKVPAKKRPQTDEKETRFSFLNTSCYRFALRPGWQRIPTFCEETNRYSGANGLVRRRLVGFAPRRPSRPSLPAKPQSRAIRTWSLQTSSGSQQRPCRPHGRGAMRGRGDPDHQPR